MSLSTLPQRPLAERAIDVVDELLLFARKRLVKASEPKAKTQRAKLQREHLAGFTADLAGWFQGLAESLPQVQKAAADIDWDPEDDIDWKAELKRLTEILERWYTIFGQAAYDLIGEQLGIEIAWDLNARGVERIMNRLGLQAKGIVGSTRDTLAGYVARAIDNGSSSKTLATELAAVLDEWGSDSGRAGVIALTESGTAYNLASLSGYRDSGIVDEVQIFDGTECGWDGHDDLDLANGSIRTLDEAEETPLSHPNCQRSWAPVVAR